MESSPEFRRNRDLFSNYYLDEYLTETEAWEDVDDDEVSAAYNDIQNLWNNSQEQVPEYNEAQLETNFIREILDILGITYEVQETTDKTQRRPDYAFFPSEEARKEAFKRRNEGDDFYSTAIAVADAKRWGRALDTMGEHRRDFANPSYQIHYYLGETPVQWGVLTNGKHWRIYYGPTSGKLDSYYEIDLPKLLKVGDIEDFKFFYLFFRVDAFIEDSSGDCFLDDVLNESNIFARELGEDLQDNIYQAIKLLAEGYLVYTPNELGEKDLDIIHDSALIYLYRLIFVFYAESEGRELLPTNNRYYEQKYSLNTIKQEVAEELDSPNTVYEAWQTDLADTIDELFELIDQGSKSKGIPEDHLYIPPYNGGLFRMDPDESDGEQLQFLADNEVGDSYLAEVIDLLARSQNGANSGKTFVDYSSLGVRHLGSIYEGLLEYHLNIADQSLGVKNGDYVPADGQEILVNEGEVYLTTDSGERKATGSYYTPEYIVDHIVENTLGPLVAEIREDLAGQSAREDSGFAKEFANRVFQLKILDPAMGSGHFLTNAVDYLAKEIIDAQQKQAEQLGVDSIDTNRDIYWARRQVAQRCIFGLDLNPLAVELTKVSLWLRTLAAEQPLAFLDHHLKTGNSLVGSDIEEVLANNTDDLSSPQLTLQQSFDRTRREALEHVLDRFKGLLEIDNETLKDIKEMETVFEEVKSDPLYQNLVSMTNVHTAEKFGIDVPNDGYEAMAEALNNGDWDSIEKCDWYEKAQKLAVQEHFFHWELEFPVVFYNEKGDRKESDGFDVVLGNPPYFNLETTKGTAFNDYLRSEYSDIYSGKADILYFFLDKGTDLFNETGSLSFIVSRYFTEAHNAKDFREKLSESTRIEEIVDFGNNQVFPGVDTLTIILTVSKSDGSGETNVIQLSDSINSDAALLSRLLSEDGIRSNSSLMMKHSVPTESLKRERWMLLPKTVREIKEKVETHGTRLGEFCRTGQGMMTGLNEAFTVTEEEIDTWGIEDKVLKPLVKNGDLRPYLYQGNDKQLIYLENEEIDDHPNTKNYLEQYREDLLNRAKADQIKWYKYQNPINKDLFENPNEKIICPFIATDNRFYVDKVGLYNDGGDVEVIHQTDKQLSNDALVAFCNSDLLEFYHLNHAKLKRDGFFEYFGNSLRDLPINLTTGDLDDEMRSQISELTSKQPEDTHSALGMLSIHIATLKKEYHQLNLNLLDYLGTYSSGRKLPDLGVFVPGDTAILNASADDYESLRISKARVQKKGNAATVQVTLRYKPESEEGFDTDTWGYIETDYFDAFTLRKVTDQEINLLTAFIPVAVQKADGFAGFREKSTKSISPIDRLKEIELPDFEDVRDDLGRYLDTKEYADELSTDIEKADELINRIIFDLYNLTEEQIKVVESGSMTSD